MFAAYHRVKEENKAKTRVFSKKSLEVEYNSLEKDFDINDLLSRNEDYWKNKADKKAQAS